jgi:hypothetical protein
MGLRPLLAAFKDISTSVNGMSKGQRAYSVMNILGKERAAAILDDQIAKLESDLVNTTDEKQRNQIESDIARKKAARSGVLSGNVLGSAEAAKHLGPAGSLEVLAASMDRTMDTMDIKSVDDENFYNYTQQWLEPLGVTNEEAQTRIVDALVGIKKASPELSFQEAVQEMLKGKDQALMDALKTDLTPGAQGMAQAVVSPLKEFEAIFQSAIKQISNLLTWIGNKLGGPKRKENAYNPAAYQPPTGTKVVKSGKNFFDAGEITESEKLLMTDIKKGEGSIGQLGGSGNPEAKNYNAGVGSYQWSGDNAQKYFQAVREKDIAAWDAKFGADSAFTKKVVSGTTGTKENPYGADWSFYASAEDQAKGKEQAQLTTSEAKLWNEFVPENKASITEVDSAMSKQYIKQYLNKLGSVIPAENNLEDVSFLTQFQNQFGPDSLSALTDWLAPSALQIFKDTGQASLADYKAASLSYIDYKYGAKKDSEGNIISGSENENYNMYNERMNANEIRAKEYLGMTYNTPNLFAPANLASGGGNSSSSETTQGDKITGSVIINGPVTIQKSALDTIISGNTMDTSSLLASMQP